MNYIQIKFNIQPRDPWVDVFSAQLGELGFDSFEDSDEGFNAYIPTKDFNAEIESFIENDLKNDAIEMSYTKDEIFPKNWNEVWESSFEPILVGSWCSIVAPFHQNVPETTHQIIIEPKMSFGTGHHQTTYMMVSAMKEIQIEGANVLDMGCGTGILGILAKKMKANYVEGIDIEDWAVENSVENCKRNDVEMEVKLGGKEQINSTNFDVVLANINRNILIDQLLSYAKCIKKNGILLLSGFLSDDEEIILKESMKSGFKLTKKYSKDNWLCLQFLKD